MMRYQNKILDGIKQHQWDLNWSPVLLYLVFGVTAPILVLLCVLIGSYALLMPIYKIAGLMEIFMLP